MPAKFLPTGAPPDWSPPPLLDFINGVHDRVVAAFTASQGASSATKGSVRESALIELGTSLPAVARLHRGDLIDSCGLHTGQLDGIVVHAGSPAVAISGSDRIVLAEGALGVLEVKSNLKAQWSEVLSTWSKLRLIRRPLSRAAHQANALKSFGNSANQKVATLWLHEQSVAFFVVGWKGWATHEKLQEKVRELWSVFGKGPRPVLFVGQLEPAGFGIVWPTGENTETTPAGETLYEYMISGYLARNSGARGVVLLNLWRLLSERARNASIIDIDWDAYMRVGAAPEVAQTQNTSLMQGDAT